MAETRNPLPAGFSSIALTELDPMSSPTRLFVRRNSTFTCLQTRSAWQTEYQPGGLADPTKSALNTGIGGSGQRGDSHSTYETASY
jgi:hypothetical protein